MFKTIRKSFIFRQSVFSMQTGMRRPEFMKKKRCREIRLSKQMIKMNCDSEII